MAAPRTGSLGVLTAKGDLLTDDGADVERLAVGADDEVLVADSAEATGLKYVPASSLPNIGPAEPFQYGSDIGSNGKFYQTGGEPDGGEIDPLDQDGEYIIEYPCELSEFSWSTMSAAAGGTPTRWQIHKNGVALASEIITTVGATGTNTPSQGAQSLSATAFVKGDRLAVLQLDGTTPGRGNVRVMVVTP